MKVVKKLKKFAAKHNLILEDHGEVGFGRPCVGFIAKGGNYVDFNPLNSSDYKYVWDRDDRLEAPAGVDAYHKHDCMTVLVSGEDYEKGLEQLLIWAEQLEKQGELMVVEFETGAEGVQALMTGVTGYSFKYKDSK